MHTDKAVRKQSGGREDGMLFDNSSELQQIVEAVCEEMSPNSQLAKKMSIYMCHQYSGCSLQEIGEYFGVGESAVAEDIKRFAMDLYKDQGLAEKVAGLSAQIAV